jgi:hypothetical protein
MKSLYLLTVAILAHKASDECFYTSPHSPELNPDEGVGARERQEAEIPYCHVKRRAQSRGDVMSEERAAPAIANQVILSHLLCKINHASMY